VSRPARASCWSEHIGGSAGVQGNGVPAGGARLGRVRARRAGPRGAAMPQSQPWQALAFCWPSSTGQGCAKVSDHRFMDSKLINYVPYVPIDHARAGYEVYAQIIVCQNSIALRAQNCEAALQCVDSAAERALGCQLGACRAGSSSRSSARHRH